MTKPIIIILLLIFASSKIHAKEIRINSNELEIDREKKISTFIGNVYVKEKDMELWAETIIIKFNDTEDEIQELYAEDKVKVIRKEITAVSDISIYNPINEEIRMIDNVEVWKNGNIIKCDELVLDIKNSTSIMKSKANQRVEALIISN